MSQPQLQVCRTCLQVIDNQKYCVNLDASDTNPTAFEIKSKLEACVPELTISVVKNPVICGQCIASLDTAFAFKRKCVDVEERIYDHLLDIDSHVVNLEFVIEQDIKCKIEPMILEDEDQFTNKVCNSTENYLNGTPTILECHTEIQNNEESHPVDVPPNGAFLKRKPNGILDSQTEVLVNPSSSFPSCFVTLSNLSEEFLKLFKSDSEDKLKNRLIHEAYSEKNDKFICFICEQNFKTKNQLKEHESTHGSQATFYMCYPYEVDRESIKMHLYRRLSKTSKRYQCGVCFSNIYGSINAHLRSHMNKDLRKCKFCRLCRIHKGRRKHRKSSLVQQKKPLEKQLVQQKKPLEKQLVQQKKPLEKQKFSCDTCEFFTINKNLLVEHVKTHRKTVSRKHHLEQRKKPLENQKPVQIFSCVTCGFLTVHKDLLTKHVETHKETPLKRPFWKCSLCGSNITSATELTKHVTCEHPGDNFYKCGVCDFVIDRVDRLKYHMRIHNGMKAFTCMLCKFRTDVRREFNEHSTIHTIAMDQRTGKGADNTKQTLGVVKNPIVCANCITSLNKAYTFKRRCLETEEKIYEYMFDCDDEEVDIQSILDVLKHKDNVMEQQDENTLSETDEKDDSLNCSAQTDDNTCEKIVDVVKGKDNVAELQEEKTPNETNEKDVSLNCSAQTDDNTCEKIVDNETELQDEKMLSETDEKDVSLNCSAQMDDNTCEKIVDNEAELQDEKPLIETDEEDVFSECSADTNDNTYENTSNVLDSKENVSLSLPSCYVVLTPLSVDWVGSYSLDDNTKNKSKQNVACTDSPKEHKHLNNKVGAENEQQQKVNPKKYYCNICEKGIKHSDIAKHSLYHKKVKKERIIFICLPFNEKTANPMQIEIAKSTEAKAKTHKCGVCGLTASYSLNVHMRIHTKEQLFRCVFCEFSSNRRNSLNRHILRQHKVTNRPVPKTDQLKYYKCGVCDYHTSNENRLKDHVKIHKSDIFYRCFYCKFNTDIAESLSSHMVDNHSNKDKFYKCVYCPFNSNRVKLLKYHSLIHTNKEVHKCALCEFVSFSRKNLIDHLRVHYTGATYTCSKCDFSTTSRPALNYHYLDIHNKEDDKQSL